MDLYIGTKLVKASPLTLGAYNEYRGWEMPENENPADEGYLVTYPDGYESWCPKKQFEEANRKTVAMNFGLAAEAMKKGKKVARRGWNGKDMFIFQIKVWTYTDGKQDNYPNLPFVAMKTADDEVVPWLCSQTDMDADDWFILD